MIGKTIGELKIGDTAEFAKTVSESDIYLYAGKPAISTRLTSMKIMPKIPFSRPVLPTVCCRRVSYPRSSEPSSPGQAAFMLNRI